MWPNLRARKLESSALGPSIMTQAESWERTKWETVARLSGVPTGDCDASCRAASAAILDITLVSGGNAHRRVFSMLKCCLLGSLALALGCSSTTETGYIPRALGDSETVQRGYYATPFSPESRAAEAEQRQRFEG